MSSPEPFAYPVEPHTRIHGPDGYASYEPYRDDHFVPDPTSLDLSKCLAVRNDGLLVALNDDGRLIAEILRLDNDERRKFRRLIISTILSLARHDPATMIMWMCYPDDIPDLNKLRPPSNSKPRGIDNSAYARRERGELPPTY